MRWPTLMPDNPPFDAAPDDAPQRVLQQFARYPEPGKVKTRLQEQLSPEEACAVHEELLLQTAKVLAASRLGETELWLDREGEHATLSAAVNLGISGPYLQRGDDLGARMHDALQHGLNRAHAVVLVGSDCPELSAHYLREAFLALESNDVVLGPAEDGGFVLIGCRRLREGVLADVPWGGDSVLEQTLRNVTKSGLSVALLPERYDIDTPADFRRWRRGQAAGAEPRCKDLDVSV